MGDRRCATARGSLGHTQRLEPGELQAMSAGAGIRHSESNESSEEAVRFLQVWIEPASVGAEPRYEQRRFETEGRRNRWQVLASGSGVDGALTIHQDAEMRVVELDVDAVADVKVKSGRYGYVHVATGSVRVGERTLTSGDAFTVEAGAEVALTALEPAQVIWFDLG